MTSITLLAPIFSICCPEITSVAAGISRSGTLYLLAVTSTSPNWYTSFSAAILCIPEIAAKTIAPMMIFPFNFIAFLLNKPNDII